MIATLKRLDDVLHPVLHRLTLIVPSVVPLEQASGAVPVEPVLASRSVPERSIALRSGLAVSSLDLVGASPHSPVVLTRTPARVTAGDPHRKCACSSAQTRPGHSLARKALQT